MACAEMMDVDFATARRISQGRSVDALAIACRAHGMDRDMFVAVAMLRPVTGKRETADPYTLAQIYEALPEDTAQRAMRFWKVRNSTENDAA